MAGEGEMGMPGINESFLLRTEADLSSKKEFKTSGFLVLSQAADNPVIP